MKNSRKNKIITILIALIAIGLLLFAWSLTQPHPNGNNFWLSLTSNFNNTRYQPNSTVDSQNVGNLTERWFIGTNAFVTSNPVVLNGNVYFADWSGNVYSANIVNGLINWRVNLGGAISSTPTLANGKVYVAFGPNQTKIFSLWQNNGSTIWNTTLNVTEKGIWGSPTVYNGLLYIGTAGAGQPGGQIDNNSSKRGQLFALNATTGKVLWNFTVMVGNAGGAAVWSSAVVDPQINSIYFGTGNAYTNGSNTSYAYSVVSLDATTGTTKWIYSAYNSHQEGDDYDFGDTPNLFQMRVGSSQVQVLGIGSKNGYYYILNRTDGKFISKFNAGTAGSSGGIIGLSGVVQKFGNDDPEIFIPSYYDIPNVTCCGMVEALVPSTNTVEWQFYTPGNIRGSVTVIPGAVLFGDNDGNLYALSIATGLPLFNTTFKNGIEGGIAVSDGYVIVPLSFFGNTTTAGIAAFSPN